MWLLSMPACTEVNRSMLELTGVTYSKGEQNKDMLKAKQEHDWKDTQTLLNYLYERNTFTFDVNLQSISNRVHASATVNVDAAKDASDAILASMEGISAAEYTFMRKNQAVMLDTKSEVKIKGVAVHIDLQLLSSNLQLPQRQMKIYRLSSSMSPAVTHQPCLIHHYFFKSHRNLC